MNTNVIIKVFLKFENTVDQLSQINQDKYLCCIDLFLHYDDRVIYLLRYL